MDRGKTPGGLGRGEPSDRRPGPGEGLVVAGEIQRRVAANWEPASSIFRITAIFLETEGAVGAHEDIHATVVVVGIDGLHYRGGWWQGSQPCSRLSFLSLTAADSGQKGHFTIFLELFQERILMYLAVDGDGQEPPFDLGTETRVTAIQLPDQLTNTRRGDFKLASPARELFAQGIS